MPVIDLARLLVNLSLALDFSRRGLMRHHQRVALVALRIGEAAGISFEERLDLFKAAIIHDAGAVTWPEKDALEAFDIRDPWEHCRRGYQFVSDVDILAPAAEIILSHHDRWRGDNPSGKAGAGIPLAARIIHLADRLDVLLTDREYILDQREPIIKQIQLLSGRVFDPDLVEIFMRLARAESFWLDITAPCLTENLLGLVGRQIFIVDLTQLMPVARLFARVIDAKSPFTHRHSRGVAAVARHLARHMGMSEGECLLMEMAGLLHDLGKLTVPESILEKPGRLTEKEFNRIKQHTYYTYWLLRPFDDQLSLARWAAYHHEKLNGQGYPFRLAGSQLCLGSRIMAVSDMFTALKEDRPYRPGLPWHHIERIIGNQVQEGALDGRVVGALFDSRRELEEMWGELTIAGDRCELE
ncbi:HD domain-containing phosphohydrolase [Desulfofundulus thermosubterraneus]|uniref:HD domain-containing protein n=1 Tax=Desulfofundulus thermosubterraneus DSM 16057 TaxID=1121432 RepID=A0A1M6ALR8_9FIRM|nr:HD domain-containing phosphohydrolase [Desulfofundulus thermosubterraneus]SHI37163.1 HD domain-containing protein [Desulfofundulus thermosubterraneus DSM 16057]